MEKFKTPGKIWTFSTLRKTYVVDVECPRCTQPVQKIKDIKNIWPRPLESKPARADAFYGSLKKASVLPSTDISRIRINHSLKRNFLKNAPQRGKVDFPDHCSGVEG